MTFPTYEEWGEKIAEQVIDVYTINGRTIREWIKILSDELTMLDKIRDEIMRLHKHKDYLDEQGITIMKVLQIIDKYKEEGSE